MPASPSAFPQSFPQNRYAHWRMFGVSVCVGLSMLAAGCASKSPASHSTASLDSPDGLHSNEADPIGALLRSRNVAARSRITLKSDTDVDADTNSGTPDVVDSKAGGLAQIAQNYLGVKYRWGGSSPKTGFDCSGLVTFVVEKSLGLRLPRNAAEIAQLGTKVDRAELEPGDLVFFNTLGRRYSHVGIYVGNNSFVHAPSSGGVVRVEKMDMRYWSKRYNGARRLEAGMVAAR